MSAAHTNGRTWLYFAMSFSFFFLVCFLLPRDEYASMTAHVEGATYAFRSWRTSKGDIAVYAHTSRCTISRSTRERLSIRCA